MKIHCMYYQLRTIERKERTPFIYLCGKQYSIFSFTCQLIENEVMNITVMKFRKNITSLNMHAYTVQTQIRNDRKIMLYNFTISNSCF